jgi:hypothetical protein
MASRNLGTLTLDLVARTGEFNAGMTAAERRTQLWAKNIGQLLSNVRGQVQGLLAGIAVAATIQKIIASTVEAENAIRQLEARLRSTGGVAGVTSQELQSLAKELQAVTTYTADAILGMQGVLLTFQNIRGENVEAATRAVLDLSAALGQDLQSSAAQVGRALNDPLKGITALQKIGVTFSTSQKQLIKSLVDAGNIAAAQGVILKQLSVAYGGAAVAAGNTLGGALQQLKNSFDNLFTAESGVSDLTKAVQDLNAALQMAGVSESFKTFTSLVVRGLANIADTITAVIKLFNWFAENSDKMFLFPQLEYVLKEFRILGTDLERIQDQIEFFEEQRDSFLPWVLSLEEGVMNLEDINEKLRELYRERGRIEQQTVRFGARPPPRRGGPARNRPIEGDEDALESLQKLTDSMRQQVATFDKGAAAVMRYRIETGDLAETFKLARADGEKFIEPLIALSAQLEKIQAAKAVKEQTDQLRDQAAVLGMSAAEAMRYAVSHGELAKTLKEMGEAGRYAAASLIAVAAEAEALTNEFDIKQMVKDLQDQVATFNQAEAAVIAYRIGAGDLAATFDRTTDAGKALARQVIDLTLQLQLMKDIAEGVDDTIDEMSESLQESLDKFSDDFEARFLEKRDVLLDFMEGLAAGTENILADALESGFEDGAKGVLKSFGALLQRLIAEAIAADIAKRLFGTVAGGTGTGWLGAIAGIFGIGAKASGGPIQAGMPYLVGERGPEIIVPRANATVIPNGRIGAQNNYISLTVETPTGRIPMETQQQLGNRLARALGDARRRNG